MGEQQTAFYKRMDVLNQYMESHKFPHPLRIRLREYFRFRKQVDNGTEWKYLMLHMSDQLQVRTGHATCAYARAWQRSMHMSDKLCGRIAAPAGA